MLPFVGTFVVDDDVNVMRLEVTDSDGSPWGTAVSTGWTVELEVRKAGVQTLLTTLTGSWEDATEAAALFTIGTVAALEPAAGLESQDYEALLKLTKVTNVARLGAGNNTDGVVPFCFKVRAWP